MFADVSPEVLVRYKVCRWRCDKARTGDLGLAICCSVVEKGQIDSTASLAESVHPVAYMTRPSPAEPPACAAYLSPVADKPNKYSTLLHIYRVSTTFTVVTVYVPTKSTTNQHSLYIRYIQYSTSEFCGK